VIWAQIMPLDCRLPALSAVCPDSNPAPAANPHRESLIGTTGLLGVFVSDPTGQSLPLMIGGICPSWFRQVGLGGVRCRAMLLPTVVREISTPSFSSSP
jgi:hypothetical protein